MCLPLHDQSRKNYQSLRLTEFLGEKRKNVFLSVNFINTSRMTSLGRLEVEGMSDRGNAVDGGMDAGIRYSWTKHGHGPRLMELWNTGLWVDGQIRVNVNYGKIFVSHSIFKGTQDFHNLEG